MACLEIRTVAWTWLQSPNLLCSCHSGTVGLHPSLWGHCLVSPRYHAQLLAPLLLQSNYTLLLPDMRLHPTCIMTMCTHTTILENISHKVTWSLENAIINIVFPFLGAWIMIISAGLLLHLVYEICSSYLTRNYSILFHSSGCSMPHYTNMSLKTELFSF